MEDQSNYLQSFVERIRNTANKHRGHSETALAADLNGLLRELLAHVGIKYEPAIDESLRKLGFSTSSRSSASRPDSLFGHVILDFKPVGWLSVERQLNGTEGKRKIEKYLDTVTSGGPSANYELSKKWVGILWDGEHLTFCQASRAGWTWSELLPMTPATLSMLIGIYRSLNRKPLTAITLSEVFARDSTRSQIANLAIKALLQQLYNPNRTNHTTMLFQEWRRLFEQISTYQLSELPSLANWARKHDIKSEDSSIVLFSLHTYYNIIVKLVTSELLTALHPNMPSLAKAIMSASSDAEVFSFVAQLENNLYYRQLQISNFLEGDFFSWYIREQSSELASAIRQIALEILQFEPATNLFMAEEIKDLLKVFYSNVVDEQIRHDLGEYYTPDWLAEYLLDAAGYTDKQRILDKVVIDPTCGSGTFLIECIVRLRRACKAAGMQPLETLRTIVHNIRGIDLNPLAVVSARANYILAISDLILELGEEIEIPVYLADAINIPQQRTESDGSEVLYFPLETEKRTFELKIPLSLVQGQVLGKVLLRCEEDLDRDCAPADFVAGLKSDEQLAPYITPSVETYLQSFYELIAQLRHEEWDTIWCRVIKNNFAPRSFGSADLVVGNPPWVRWSRLPQGYRNRVKSFCEYYGLVSGRTYSGGIESDISTVITYSSVDNWLKCGGRVAFLITWTVFKSASARGFRLGELPNGACLQFIKLEDLTAIRPFPDAENETSIFIGQKVCDTQSRNVDEIAFTRWKPRGTSRIDPQSTLAQVRENIDFIDGIAKPVRDLGSPLFTGSREDYYLGSKIAGETEYYFRRSHRGTVNDRARIFWVKVLCHSPRTNRSLIRTLSPLELRAGNIAAATKGTWVEDSLLYPLLRGRDVGRFCYQYSGWHQIIPNKHYSEMATEADFRLQYPLTYRYLEQYRRELTERSSYKRYQYGKPFYCIYCVGEYSFAPYKVVWPEQQDPAEFRASVVTEALDALGPNKIIVPDHKLYFCVLDSLEEAHYLCGFLNSKPLRRWLGGFLLGKQIGTSIFEYISVPRFDPESPLHRRIAQISVDAHKERSGTTNKRFLRKELEDELETLVLTAINEMH